MVRVFKRGGSIFICPAYVTAKEADEMIEEHIANVKRNIVIRNKLVNHVIYATKVYNADGKFIEANLYDEPMDDQCFYARTEATYDKYASNNKHCVIYAYHKDDIKTILKMK